jgi:hypothetical protein
MTGLHTCTANIKSTLTRADICSLPRARRLPLLFPSSLRKIMMGFFYLSSVFGRKEAAPEAHHSAARFVPPCPPPVERRISWLGLAMAGSETAVTFYPSV